MSSNPKISPGSGAMADRAKSILGKPKAEWRVIAGERTGAMQVLTGYALWLAAIPPICTFVGGQLFFYNYLFLSYRPSLMSGLTTALASYVLTIVGLFVLAFIANKLAPKFGGRENWDQAFKLVAYSMTAIWVAGVFQIIPALSFLTFFGLYSIYLFYAGSGPVMGVPKDKAIAYTAVTAILALIVGIVISLFMSIGTIGSGTLSASGIEASGDRADIDLGEFGRIEVEGGNSVIDMGEFGRIETDGNTTTITGADGEQFTTTIEVSGEE